MIKLNSPKSSNSSSFLNNKLFQIVLFSLFLFCGQKSWAQLDNIHYLSPFFCTDYGTANWTDEEVHLTTPSTSTIIITVTDGAGNLYGAGNNGSPGLYEISNGSPYILDFELSTDDQYLSVYSDQVGIVQDGNGAGLKLTSTDDFYANFKVRGTGTLKHVLVF